MARIRLLAAVNEVDPLLRRKAQLAHLEQGANVVRDALHLAIPNRREEILELPPQPGLTFGHQQPIAVRPEGVPWLRRLHHASRLLRLGG